MTDENTQLLAAITYEDGTGDTVDSVLYAVVDRLRASECRMVGAIKHRETQLGRTRCDMSLEDISSGEIIPISQNLGPEARGCTLDFAALERAVGLTLAGLERGSDFLILNRFGKREECGHGFRSAIEHAVSNQIPCIVGLGQNHVQGWKDFTGPMAVQLPCNVETVWDWCSKAQSKAVLDA